MAQAERFWAKVDKTDGCWAWAGTRNRMGYGVFHASKLGQRLAHRWSWTLTFGPVPDGLCVLHRCDNPPCVNPDHLFLGTLKDNTQDMLAKGRDGHGRMPGSSHPNAKLTEDDVIDIRTVRALGASYPDIAKAYGITKENASMVARGVSWGHV